MQSLNVAKKLIPAILFFLLTVFSVVPRSVAANLLLIMAVLFSTFLHKTRSTNQPRYGKSC
ncbi:MAG: hypothetical protein F4031_07095 [Candidatus Dadabacteria bacterium]|nr:hypothetical protein [Candidatus Dadabacteria bacterium]MYK50041.1 hypothetical protein [Candidatus Dadabacteria bacterium]